MSASTPENQAKAATKRVIEEVCKRRGLKYSIDWNAGSPFMSMLDASGVIAGHPFVAEVKRFDVSKPLTARQKMRKKEYEEAGAFVHDIVDPTSLKYLEQWLETLEPREPHSL